MAGEGDGSVFHALESEHQLSFLACAKLFWTAGDRLVFPWERTGWLHLYSISTDGPPTSSSTAIELTPGEFEVDHASLGSDLREIVYSFNQSSNVLSHGSSNGTGDDIDRRHIWKVATSGGPPICLTQGDGIEWSPVMTSDGKAVALLHSDPRWPARPAIIQGNQPVRDVAPGTIPADFPGDALVSPEPVIHFCG